MLTPPIPSDEKERLKTLYELNILDTPVEESFERITRLTKELFKVPIVAISFIDENRQWFKSIEGLNIQNARRETSFCAHAMVSDQIFHISNALDDYRFSDNPYVIGEPYIRFYAGYPIKASNGKKLGTVCIIDRCPRTFSNEDLDKLKDIANLIEGEIKKRSLSVAQNELLKELGQANRKSLLDPLTGLWNRAGMNRILNYQMQDSRKKNQGFGIAIMDIDHFKLINDTYGHVIGDKVLRKIAGQLVMHCREKDAVARWGGEEFMILYNTPQRELLLTITERFRESIAQLKVDIEKQEQKVTITATFGLAVFIPNINLTQEKLIIAADQALYRGKELGRNRICAAWNDS